MQSLSFAWRVFICVELAAVLAWITCGYFTSMLGPFLWYVQFFLLLPGSLLGGAIVEGPLWMTGLSMQFLSVLGLGVGLLANAALWWCVLRAYRRLRSGVAP